MNKLNKDGCFVSLNRTCRRNCNFILFTYTSNIKNWSNMYVNFYDLFSRNSSYFLQQVLFGLRLVMLPARAFVHQW